MSSQVGAFYLAETRHDIRRTTSALIFQIFPDRFLNNSFLFRARAGLAGRAGWTLRSTKLSSSFTFLLPKRQISYGILFRVQQIAETDLTIVKQPQKLIHAYQIPTSTLVSMINEANEQVSRQLLEFDQNHTVEKALLSSTSSYFAARRFCNQNKIYIVRIQYKLVEPAENCISATVFHAEVINEKDYQPVYGGPKSQDHFLAKLRQNSTVERQLTNLLYTPGRESDNPAPGANALDCKR